MPVTGKFLPSFPKETLREKKKTYPQIKLLFLLAVVHHHISFILVSTRKNAFITLSLMLDLEPIVSSFRNENENGEIDKRTHVITNKLSITNEFI